MAPVVAHRHVCGLDAILTVDAVFHSTSGAPAPGGEALTRAYLTVAFSVLGNDSFRYVREVVGEGDDVLEFVAEVEGIHVNGVDIIRWNDEGKIVDFKVMLRPLKRVNLIHQIRK